MHSMMEGEGGSEPQDVFVQLGTLIVEGRVPGGGNARGYSEGPHCSAQGLSNATPHHLCNPQQNLLCKRAENFRKHMLLLFQNNIPMCIEVLLCSDCPCGVQKSQSADVGVVPSATDLLLEQWTITFVNRLNEPAPMLPRGLMQAVRSQLHFSQLSAWWSSTKGIHPNHVSYRITVPGQAFASQFSRPPNEHTFPLASVGKNGAIKVCARSLPRMELVPTIHCPLHSTCLPSSVDAGEKPCLPATFLPGSALHSETTVSGSSVVDGARGSSLGESLLDPPQRFHSPPRASEAPDRFQLFRRVPAEAVGARWQGDTPPSPPLGLPGLWWKQQPCLSSKLTGQLCPRAAAAAAAGASHRKHTSETGKEKLCGMSGLLDDRMQMECNTPGKHHCSCEVEEEIEEVKTPTQIRQRRRSQASMPPHSSQPLPSTSSASDVTCNTEGVANESTKRSGLAVMSDEYLYTSDGGNGSNTGSLKRRRPVLDASDPSSSAFQGKSWMDPEFHHDLIPCASNTSAASGGAVSFGLSPTKGATAPIQLQPPLSKRELEEVLKVLRDRNKPNVRQGFQSQQVFYSTESSSKLKDMVDSSNEMSDAHHLLYRSGIPAEMDKKSNKTVSLIDAAVMHLSGSVHVCQSPCPCCRSEIDDVTSARHSGKEESNCDKNWSGTKHKYCVKRNVKCIDHSCCGVSGGKPSSDLSEDHNNQVICDKHTSLQNCDIGDSYLCLSCVSQTRKSQTKEGNQPLTTNSSLILSCKNTPLSRPVRARSRKGDCSSISLAVQCVTQELQKDFQSGYHNRQDVPSASERARFRRSFDNAASMVFHTRTGLPLTSSPAPVRRGASHFDYDSSLNSVSAIRSALFDTPAIASQMEDTLSLSSDDTESEGGARSPCSPDAGIAFPSPGPCHALSPCFSLLGSFEESVLNGRLEPVSTVQGFTAEIGASGSFCPRHLKLPVTVFFYTLGDYDKVSTPYLGHINLGKKGYNVPKSGTIQVTLFNPMGTVIKMFVVMYDLTDMPPNSHTFLRQRTLYMPTGTEVLDDLPDSEMTQKWLRYLIHLRFSSSKSGRIYLHTDARMIIFRKSDMDTASVHNNNNIDSGFELRSFTHGPGNPKFSPR